MLVVPWWARFLLHDPFSCMARRGGHVVVLFTRILLDCWYNVGSTPWNNKNVRLSSVRVSIFIIYFGGVRISNSFARADDFQGFEFRCSICVFANDFQGVRISNLCCCVDFLSGGWISKFEFDCWRIIFRVFAFRIYVDDKSRITNCPKAARRRTHTDGPLVLLRHY